jgi:hypothetical protein
MKGGLAENALYVAAFRGLAFHIPISRPTVPQRSLSPTPGLQDHRAASEAEDPSLELREIISTQTGRDRSLLLLDDLLLHATGFLDICAATR